jgi:glucokinase
MGKKRFAVGFDMGGTKMLATVLDESYAAHGKEKARTPASGSNEEILEAMVEVFFGALKDAGVDRDDVEAIGVAIPGPIDHDAGVVKETPNAGMRDFALRDALGERLGMPVTLENDVNAGTYGEYVSGAGAGARNIVGLFPGTGVGGGLILDGKLYRGHHGMAGEIGHMIVQVNGRLCGCGHRGCLEAVASKTAIAKELVQLAAGGASATLLEKDATDITRIKSGVIKEAYTSNETGPREVVDTAAWFLGIGIANCINIFDPELVIVGGGLVEKLGDLFLQPAIASMKQHVMVSPDTPVVAAQLGDDAVVIGAAALARESAA